MWRNLAAKTRFRAGLGGAALLAVTVPPSLARMESDWKSNHPFMKRFRSQQAEKEAAKKEKDTPTKKLIVEGKRMIEDSGCSLNEAAAMEKELYWEGGTEDPFHVFRRETGLPEMTLEEVRKHPADETWVILDGGVYNVTTFLDAHPGGAARIQMTTGQDLRKFWSVYTLHDRPHIRALLERYRVGTLSPEDAKRAYDETPDFGSYYESDPTRPRQDELRIPTIHPYNAEPQLHALIDNYYTPNDLFFVRNHNNVPDIDGQEWRLEVSAEEFGVKAKSFSLSDIKTKFPRTEVIATLQCAGNRQEDFVQRDRPLYVAPHWRNGAIGNAKWAGVRVRDLLRDVGIDVDGVALRQKEYPGMKIVNFIGTDEDETGTPYAGVLPVEKVIDPFGDAILAYEMNGETLPRDHGYPVRLLAPGHAGCRNVKWVSEIIVSSQVSELDSGSKLDRHFAPDISFLGHIRHGDDMIRLDQGPVIQTLPVQSVICEPLDGQSLVADADGKIVVRGVAWSGAGRGVCRVEVSTDAGETFTAAELIGNPDPDAPSPECGMGRNWAWQQYAQSVELSAADKAKLARGESVEIELVARAIDGDFNQQPEKMEQTWNVLGICVNHWPRVKATILPPESSSSDLPLPPAPPPAGSYDRIEYAGMYQNTPNRA